MKTLFFYVIPLSFVLFSFSGYAATCKFEAEANSVQVGWTAFKTMQKVAVQGTFADVAVSGKLQMTGHLSDLLKQLAASISLKDQNAVKTGNPARDQTLFEHFFKLFKNTKTINGKITKIEGNDSEGSFILNLKMNEKELGVPMRFNRDTAGHFEAKGGIDVLDFALQSAFDDLHKTCEKLHTGPDGQSKTWPTVEIKISANLIQKCDQ